MQKAPLLLSIDLEDVRDWVAEGHKYRERVPLNTEKYLNFCHSHGIKATFFIVGRLALKYPSLIRDIISEGHEVACHTHSHVQLDKHTPESFREDMLANLESLSLCGATSVNGFRAPTFSLTESTQWVYSILSELGFTYSSSVLPADNPLYGWKEFGRKPKVVDDIVELPMTLYPSFPSIPIAGGVYFRIMPFFAIKSGVRKLMSRQQPIQTYFHPYDIDVYQERFMHPDLGNSKLYNGLMYIGRSRVLQRLEKLIELCNFTTYKTFLSENDIGI